MVEYLSPKAERQLRCCMVAVAIWSFTEHLGAQGLIDPTRPPTELTRGETSPALDSGPVLQSVIISQRRAEAIISGRTVKVGDKIGEATVVKITEGEVVLREGKDLRALKLFPGIDKRTGSVRGGNRAENRP